MEATDDARRRADELGLYPSALKGTENKPQTLLLLRPPTLRV